MRHCGFDTWATVALEQGLPYFGVALTGMRYHEVMDHLKGEGRKRALMDKVRVDLGGPTGRRGACGEGTMITALHVWGIP